MFLDLKVGHLREPLTGRHWDPEEIRRQLFLRSSLLLSHGLANSDRVLLHHGNQLEFFVDLLAVWNLGACAIPIDTRLTLFETETLARAARPRLSLWTTAPDESARKALGALGIDIIQTGEVSGTSRQSERGTAQWRAFHLDQEALILFTSGTTGQPKGVVHSHRTLRRF